MTTTHTQAGLWPLNLLVPGAGLIVAGSPLAGSVLAILFTLCACGAIAANYLFPDDFSQRWRLLLAGAAGGVWVGTQLRLAQVLREGHFQAQLAERRTALRQAHQLLAAEKYDEAWQAISRIAHLAHSDLLVAYRMAQIATARGDVAAARAAWHHVRKLDTHRVYHPEYVQARELLGFDDDQAG